MAIEVDGVNLQALFALTHGLYVVSSHSDGGGNGQIADAVMQVAAEPPALAVSISKRNLTHGLIEKSRVFSVSVLGQSTPFKFIGLFGFKSGRDVDKLSQVEHSPGITGCPVVTENAVAAIEAKLVGSVDAGTHTVFIGEIVAAGRLNDGPPLTYAWYREHLKGRTPKNAPGYIPRAATGSAGKGKRGGGKMQKYACTICSYLYDPEIGDPDNGVEPGTAFEDLPDDWVCPVCGAEKSEFEPEE